MCSQSRGNCDSLPPCRTGKRRAWRLPLGSGTQKSAVIAREPQQGVSGGWTKASPNSYYSGADALVRCRRPRRRSCGSRGTLAAQGSRPTHHRELLSESSRPLPVGRERVGFRPSRWSTGPRLTHISARSSDPRRLPAAQFTGRSAASGYHCADGGSGATAARAGDGMRKCKMQSEKCKMQIG